MIARVVAVDPGPKCSAVVVWDGRRILSHDYLENDALLAWMVDYPWGDDDPICVEMIASYGMAVGKDVFETCVWIGRILQAWGGGDEQHLCHRMFRNTVKLHLCKKGNAKDSNIRQALIDRFGGKGRKCQRCKGKGWTGRGRISCDACGKGGLSSAGWEIEPGVCAELTGDKWAAMAVAVTWWDKERPQIEAAYEHQVDMELEAGAIQ